MMISFLFLLFVVLPATELALLIEIGRRIGTVETLALIVVTGVIGASLARHQGIHVMRKIAVETSQGRMPGGELVEGLIILIAAALLVTPGILTDVFGLLCLIPFTRQVMKGVAVRWFERRIQSERSEMTIYFSEHVGPPPGPRPMRNITPEDEDSGRDS